MEDLERSYNRTVARERLEQTVKAFEDMAQDIRQYLNRFDQCENDLDRSKVINWAIHRAVQQPNYRVDLLADSQAALRS